jgi:hypothetical protein
MVNEEDLQAIGDILWDLLTDEVPDPNAEQDEAVDLIADSLEAIEAAGYEGVTPEDLQQAIAQLSDSLSAQQQAQLEPLRDAIANQPAPVVQQIIQQEAAPPDQVTVVRHVTEVTNVTNIDEGDQIVDQSVNTTILAEGDVDFDQQVSNTANVGDDGAVVVGGDVSDSAVNTGQLDGVQAGGDVSIEDSAIGDGNVLVNDSEFDALAVGGDATNVEAGGDANVGSGTQVGIDAGGDVQATVGDANDVTGDQTANVNNAPAVVEEPAFDEPIESQVVESADLQAEAMEIAADEAAIELDA